LSSTAQGLLTKTLCVALKGAEVNGAKSVVSVTVYVGDSTYAALHTVLLSNYVDTADGWRVFSRATQETGTLSTTGSPVLSSAVRCKLRLTFSGGNPTTGTAIWASPVSVAPTPKASVIITADDGTSEWYSYLYPALRARGLRASCGLDAGYIDQPGFLTKAQAREIQQSGVIELTNHGANNGAYSTVGLSQYLTNLDLCDALLQELGASAIGRKLHAYVQGSRDATLVAEMRNRGFLSMREVGAEGRLVRPLLTKKCAPTNVATASSLHNRFDLPAALNLGSGTDVAECVTLIEEAKKAGGTVVIMGHQFGASVASLGWIAGYDASYGMSNLLDYLAFERASGNIDVPTWSQWVSALDLGAEV
jgi:peptidoglycan/xylan/chitin deacetylase (PgdA/CDA1 family)